MFGKREEKTRLHYKEKEREKSCCFLPVKNIRIQFVCKTTILGCQKATVLKSLKIDSEALERSLEIQDKERKKRSTAMKAPKRITRSAKNTTEYNPGGF